MNRPDGPTVWRGVILLAKIERDSFWRGILFGVPLGILAGAVLGLLWCVR